MSNLRKYNKSRFYLLVSGLPYSLISIFHKRQKNLFVINSFHNNKFDSNSKYLFLYIIKNMKNITVKFVINDNILRKNLNEKYGKYFIETLSHNGKMNALSASYWFVSSLELPVSGIFMRFRRTVVHLGHGSPLKNVGLLEKNISFLKKIYYYIIRTNITLSLASSESLQKVVQAFLGIPKNRVIISGQPRNDRLFEKVNDDSGINHKGYKVLYAPTWRHYSDTKLFPFNDFNILTLSMTLKKYSIHIYVRIHPNFEYTIDDELLKAENIHLFSGKKYPEISDYLSSFNCLITDYSSIFFDFILLRRPVLFLPYDLKEYEDKVGFALPFDEYTPGPKPNTMKNILEHLISFSKGSNLYINEIENVIKKTTVIERDNCKDLLEKVFK